MADIVKKTDGFRAFLEVLKPKLLDVLPAHMPADRLIRVVLAESTRNQQLLMCDRASIALALLTCSQLGLEPSSPLGYIYLIPRYNNKTRQLECSLLIGYKGMLELVRRSGSISRINADVFYTDELRQGHIRIQKEPPNITHEWNPGIDRHDDNIAGAYCIIETDNRSKYQVVLTKQDIDYRRSRSGSRGGGPWQTDYAAMARKSAIRALAGSGVVPITAELATAMAIDVDCGGNGKTTYMDDSKCLAGVKSKAIRALERRFSEVGNTEGPEKEKIDSEPSEEVTDD
jgi:recombination protein RecT